MLIDGNEIKDILSKRGIQIRGAFHIGAHQCEEMEFYKLLGLEPKNVIWIDALENMVVENKFKGIPNVYQAVITDKDDEDITFNVSNNVQSSSIFEFGTHAKNHPHVNYTVSIPLKTLTIDSFFMRNGLGAKDYNFWNFDIQGAEYLALQGAKYSIQWPDAIYLEVNTEEVYKGCGLISQIDTFLGNYGFERVRTEITYANWGDALYIRSNK